MKIWNIYQMLHIWSRLHMDLYCTVLTTISLFYDILGDFIEFSSNVYM